MLRSECVSVCRLLSFGSYLFLRVFNEITLNSRHASPVKRLNVETFHPLLIYHPSLTPWHVFRLIAGFPAWIHAQQSLDVCHNSYVLEPLRFQLWRNRL